MGYAILVDNTVVAILQEVTRDMGTLLWVPCDDSVEIGWVLDKGVLAPPQEPLPDPVGTAHSYMLADASTVHDLRAAVATILGIPLE